MKKCLHLRKTKPHWRRKPPKVATRKERAQAERRKLILRRDPFLLPGDAMMAEAAMAALLGRRR